MNAPKTPLDIGTDFGVDLAFYGLRARPFRPTVDSRFLWLGVKQRQGLAMLKAGIERDAGLMELTGDAGTGKTTLTNALVDSLGEEVAVARVWHPGLEPLEFFRVIAGAYRLRGDTGSREAFLAELGDFLAETRREGRKVLLVIDWAQCLGHELFEELRHLCSLGGGGPETGSESALNVLLVGRKELGGVLPEPLARRVTLRWTVESLTADEVAAYVAHRLQAAGSARNPFSAEAVQEVWALSGGVPRLVNELCDRALLAGGRVASVTIGPEIVTQGVSRLGTPGVEQKQSEQGWTGTPGARASRGGLRRSAPAIAVGVVLIALTAAVAAYIWSPGRHDSARRAAGTTAVAEPAQDTRPADPIAQAATSGAGPGTAAAEATPPVATLAMPGADPAAAPAQPAVPVPEPATPLPATAGPAEAAPATRVETSLPAMRPRPVEPAPTLRAAPRARAPVQGSAVKGRARGVPESAPGSARDGAADAPARRRPPVVRGDAGDRGDPDPAAVIDWLLNEYATGRR